MSNDEKCFIETLKACCCICDNQDNNGKTCYNGKYIIKKHGYCQDFTEKTKKGGF